MTDETELPEDVATTIEFLNTVASDNTRALFAAMFACQAASLDEFPQITLTSEEHKRILTCICSINAQIASMLDFIEPAPAGNSVADLILKFSETLIDTTQHVLNAMQAGFSRASSEGDSDET